MSDQQWPTQWSSQPPEQPQTYPSNQEWPPSQLANRPSQAQFQQLPYGQGPYDQPQWNQQPPQYGQYQQTQYGSPPAPYNLPIQQQWQPPQQQFQAQPPLYQQSNIYIQQPQPRPKRKIWFILGIIAAVIFFACIGSALASRSNNTGTVTKPIQNSASSTTPAPVQNQHFKVGQVVKVGDTWDVTVNSVKTSQGQDYSTPKSGSIYLLIDVSLKNISASEQNVSSLLQFTLRDASGQEYTESVTTFTKPPDGKVEAGAPLRGTLAYEVPTTEHQFTFAFVANIADSGQSIWDVQI